MTNNMSNNADLGLNFPVANAAPNVLLNLGQVTLPLPPYLFVSITGNPSWQLNENCLYDYLKTVVSSKDTVELGEQAWLEFAKQNHLMAGELPLTKPHKWFLGNKRWITITKQTDWEIHLHFGFINNPNEKHTHIQLALDTKHWLDELAGKSAYWWKLLTPKPEVAGDARIASYDTGIQIVPRHSFIKTLKSKESATSAVGICVPCIGFLVKNYQPSGTMLNFGPYVIGAFAVVIASTFLTAVIRHFFALPRFSWAVEQLKD